MADCTIENWPISLAGCERGTFSAENHVFVRIPEFLARPEAVINAASLQNFANITPQYPGIRSALPENVCTDWLKELAPVLDANFGASPGGWEMQAWFSIVTTRPNDLIPLQCFPHVDGTDPNQLAMMLYLHKTGHGGTAFFRHRSTGLSALTAETFPRYQAALQRDVQQSGLPKPAYVTDGLPHFERIHAFDGAFNEAVFYHGNILHSGVIENAADLPADPATGRLTINAFFRLSGAA